MSGFCTQCSAPFRPDDRFCGKCGAPRGDETDAPASPAPVGARRSAGGGAAPQKRSPFLSLLLGLLGPLVLGAVFFFGVGDCSGEATGSVRVSGARGDFTFAPTGCQNTQPFAGRMGANLYVDGNNTGSVYVLAGLHGTEVEIEVPGSCTGGDGRECTVFPVPRDRCQTFDARVDPTSTSINDVRVVEGSVRLDCTLEDGTEVEGAITFSGCGP